MGLPDATVTTDDNLAACFFSSASSIRVTGAPTTNSILAV
jgi:hypothetical protein